jgi:putative ABC transport system ATP-binding protein
MVDTKQDSAPAFTPMARDETGHKPFIEIKNLRKEYPVSDETVVALHRINLAIPRGQICCIYGESGSGKSTLLNQLAGMEKPTKGGVRIGGVVVSQLSERELAMFRQKHLGFVFQSYNLLPNLTAVENVAMPLMFRGIARGKREAVARGILKRVGLGKRLRHYPTQMSGGQQQRVGIARAFVTKPEVVFADEPTGNLDSKTKIDVMDMMCDFAHEFHQTIVLVTHDENMAKYADRIVTVLDGRIIDDTMPYDLRGARQSRPLSQVSNQPVSQGSSQSQIPVQSQASNATSISDLTSVPVVVTNAYTQPSRFPAGF